MKITIADKECETRKFVDLSVLLEKVIGDYSKEEHERICIATTEYWDMGDLERNLAIKAFVDILEALEDLEPELYERFKDVEWPHDVKLALDL